MFNIFTPGGGVGVCTSAMMYSCGADNPLLTISANATCGGTEYMHVQYLVRTCTLPVEHSADRSTLIPKRTTTAQARKKEDDYLQ